MIIMLNVFHAIVLDNPKKIPATSSVDILGITIDNELNCSLRINKICLKSANILNAFVRLKCFLMKKEKS